MCANWRRFLPEDATVCAGQLLFNELTYATGSYQAQPANMSPNLHGHVPQQKGCRYYKRAPVFCRDGDEDARLHSPP